MQPKLIQTELAKYVPAKWTGSNTSGYRPLGDMVIVLCDQVQSTTPGGIGLPDDVIERLNMASESGVIVAVADGAFKWSADRRRPFEGAAPSPGTHVYIERYAGQILNGQDGQKYRLLADKQVGAIRDAS